VKLSIDYGQSLQSPCNSIKHRYYVKIPWSQICGCLMRMYEYEFKRETMMNRMRYWLTDSESDLIFLTWCQQIKQLVGDMWSAAQKKQLITSYQPTGSRL
jgi:hypothetical protein